MCEAVWAPGRGRRTMLHGTPTYIYRHTVRAIWWWAALGHRFRTSCPCRCALDVFQAEIVHQQACRVITFTRHDQPTAPCPLDPRILNHHRAPNRAHAPSFRQGPSFHDPADLDTDTWSPSRVSWVSLWGCQPSDDGEIVHDDGDVPGACVEHMWRQDPAKPGIASADAVAEGDVVQHHAMAVWLQVYASLLMHHQRRRSGVTDWRDQPCARNDQTALTASLTIGGVPSVLLKVVRSTSRLLALITDSPCLHNRFSSTISRRDWRVTSLHYRRPSFVLTLRCCHT